MANHEAILRGDKMMKARAERQLVVFGAGAIGSTLADHFARIGFRKVLLCDCDRIEQDNLLSQIYDKKEIGKLKVDAMKNRVFNTTGVQIETESRRITKENITKIVKKYPADTIFLDCFDNEISRKVLYDNIPSCIHVGLAKDYCEIVHNDDYRVPQRPEGIDACDYPQARSLALISVAIVAEVVNAYMLTGKKNNYCCTLNDLKIGPY